MSVTATNPEAEPGAYTELTNELAKVLAAVEACDGDGQTESPPATTAALSVLARLGFIHAGQDGGWFAETAGREALAARKAAAVAAARQKLINAYAAVVAELHAIADAIDAVPVDGLAELTVAITISTKLYGRGAGCDPVKVATVDAVAMALLGKTATSHPLSDFMNHKAEGRRGPVEVEVHAFIDDPTVARREQADREREAELERLRTELAELRAAAVGGLDADRDQHKPTGASTVDPGGTREWLVWSHHHSMWWRANGSGYCGDAAGAGRYTFAEADEACSRRSWPDDEHPPEVAVVLAPGIWPDPDLMRGLIAVATSTAVARRRRTQAGAATEAGA